MRWSLVARQDDPSRARLRSVGCAFPALLPRHHPSRRQQGGGRLDALKAPVGSDGRDSRIGDMPNDVLMFRKSGLSIAMGNASPEVKASRHAGNCSNDDEGFAKAIEQFVSATCHSTVSKIGGDPCAKTKKQTGQTFATVDAILRNRPPIGSANWLSQVRGALPSVCLADRRHESYTKRLQRARAPGFPGRDRTGSGVMNGSCRTTIPTATTGWHEALLSRVPIPSGKHPSHPDRRLAAGAAAAAYEVTLKQFYGWRYPRCPTSAFQCDVARALARMATRRHCSQDRSP